VSEKTDPDRVAKVRIVSVGVYIPVPTFMALPHHQRFLRVVAARVLRCPDTVFTGETALMLAGFPVYGTPAVVEVAVGKHQRMGIQRNTASVSPAAPENVQQAVSGLPRIHCGLQVIDDAVETGGYVMVPLPQSVARAVARVPFARALAVADGWLRYGGMFGLGADDLGHALELERSERHRERVQDIIDLADPLTDNAAESAGRALMLQHGFEHPEIQHRFVDSEGELFGDYYFPSKDVDSELDGFGKYLDPELTHGLSVREVLAKEKRRQARIEAICFRVVRFTRDELIHEPEVVVERLHRAGVPSDPTWRVRIR
jgi:hypothetical protein